MSSGYHNIGIQMNQKELTKTFMAISKRKKTHLVAIFLQITSALQGLIYPE